MKALKKPAEKTINNSSKNIPITKPTAPKTAKLVIPPTIQISAAGKKAKNDPITIARINKKFNNIKRTPISKDTSKCSENNIQAFLTDFTTPFPSNST